MRAFEGYREMSLEELLSDESIEAIAVETEEIYLTKYAIMAAEAGKHIHMEKPGGVSGEDFSRLISIIKEKDLVFHTGYMYRYNPLIQKTKERIRSGEFGDIISVEAQMSGFREEEMTEWLKTFPGGMMFYLGCHLVDLVYSIMGKPKRVIPFNYSSGTYKTDALDNCFAIFEYDRGVSFVKTSQAERGGYGRRQLVITGTKGSIELKPLEVNVAYPLLRTDYRECFSDDFTILTEKHESELFDRYSEMMESFAQMVRGEKKNPVTPDYELELHGLLMLACGRN
jgi:predicted dehydrogenase